MVPPSLSVTDVGPQAPSARPPIKRWVRWALVGMAGVLVGVFVIAWALNPYHPDGRPRRMGTHEQLLKVECNFKRMTGVPCPSCGMTTSFAFLVRGDVPNSLRANAVGTLLAVCWLLTIPWALASAWRNRLVGIRSLERALVWSAAIFFGLMLLRWVIVLAIGWYNGTLSET